MAEPFSIDYWDKREAQDQKQEPWADFIEGHYVPKLYLAGIEPDAGHGTNVFCNPDKECSQKYRDEKGHTSLFLIYLKMHPCSPKNNEYIYIEEITNVVEEVVRKKV